MIKVKNLNKSFDNSIVLDDLSFELLPNSITALIGPTGVGKSVLLKIIAKVINMDSGSIDYQDLKSNDISLMFQEGALFDSISVFDNVAFPLTNGKVPIHNLDSEIKDEVTSKVVKILDLVGLKKSIYKMPAQISGGMKRRVSLARALVNLPKLALLDDPTSGLDPIASSVIMDLIYKLQDELNSTILMVSHDLRRLIPISDQIYALFDGKIIFKGSESEILNSNKKLIDFINCRYELK